MTCLPSILEGGSSLLLYAVKVLVAQSCLTLCNPMDCSPPDFSVHGILQARTLEWVAHSLLQGVFPTQGSSSSLLHCRQILYHLSHQGSPCVKLFIFCCAVAQSCLTLCDPMDCSMPGFPVLHHLLEFSKTHVH